jgi:hypothetical protein
MRIIITESQLKLLNEIVGVPENILQAAEKLYSEVEKHVKSINSKEEEYEFYGSLDVELGVKKKIQITDYKLTVKTEEIENYNGKPDIASMGVLQAFMFDRKILMKVSEKTPKLELVINFVVSENWEPYELYEEMEKDKVNQIASLAHELKHKYDKQAKPFALIGKDAEYQATQSAGTFGIPAIDRKFFRYAYFISGIENLVRPTEIASQMRSQNIKKSDFEEFTKTERVFKELTEIKNYTFEKFIEEIKSNMSRVDALLDYIDEDYSDMDDDEKIETVLNLVYMNIANRRAEIFIEMTSEGLDDLIRMSSVFGQIPSTLIKKAKELQKTDEVRKKFLSYVTKHQNNPIKFFEEEIENFSYVANKMLKRLVKLYSIAKDEDVNESIQNWDLHQKLMEKKYGKRKIETTYKFKNFK